MHISLLPEQWQWVNNQALGIALSLAVSVAVSILFYKYIELPIHNKARNFKTRARKKELAQE